MTERAQVILLHELTHWTGVLYRLDRRFGERLGEKAYAFEELVAKLGAAFMCACFGIISEPRPDHAAYVASWLTVLNDDHRAVFTAATRARQAIQYLEERASSELDHRLRTAIPSPQPPRLSRALGGSV